MRLGFAFLLLSLNIETNTHQITLNFELREEVLSRQLLASLRQVTQEPSRRSDPASALFGQNARHHRAA